MALDNIEIRVTADGSHTLYVTDLDETYHSVHGAIQEAVHVYVNAGFNFFKDKKSLAVLEVGFGTGLNTFLTYREGLKNNVKVSYSSIEAYPLSLKNIECLNYLGQLNATEGEVKLFNEIHQTKWNKESKLTNQFVLRKLEMLLQNFKEKEVYDVVYFDAFGPQVQPELWEAKILQLMYDSLLPKGILVTYCAKGSVKRALKEVGFTIENIPGPPGKREMTRAIKN
jgi:tRNA U34 5-methylaminomethyl-2-thiouridine-forming methyltransferase MnmC